MSDADFAADRGAARAAEGRASRRLDALAAYVASLGADHAAAQPVPQRGRRADGAGASPGAACSARAAARSCHAGAALHRQHGRATAPLHDVGTLRTTSGGRLGGPLTGIDTPTLLGVWETAPYFHDGSAPTLDDVFRVAGGTRDPGRERHAVERRAARRTSTSTSTTTTPCAAARTCSCAPRRRALTFTGVDGGPGGTGAIEVRVSDARAIALTVTVNGIVHNVALPNAGNDPTWRHTNWLAARAENVTLTADASNTIVIGTTDAFPDISIDEIVVTTASHLTSAAPHRRVLALSAGDRANLVAYLRQLDGTPEYNPDPGAGDLFADGFEYGVAAWSAAAP